MGKGWMIIPTIVEIKIAAKCQASSCNPSGVGISQMIKPGAMVINHFNQYRDTGSGAEGAGAFMSL